MSKKDKSFSERLLATLGSYGLCCLCLITLFVLTLFGTLYQVDHGLFEAKQVYFNSWFLWADLGETSIPYFPGGVLAMSVLTLNLIVGGLLRIRWSVRNVGVIIIHFGIIFMLVAGLVKMTKAEEGHLTLWESDNPRSENDETRSDHFRSYQLWEIAIWEVKNASEGTEFVIGDEFFTDLEGDATRRFTNAGLPFALDLKGFIKNCDVLPKGPRWEATGEVIDGYGIMTRPPEKESERDIAGIHAEVSVGGVSQRGILYGAQQSPWVIDVNGRIFAIDMRHERYPMPFEIRLEKFIKEDHAGITMAKAYRSEVTRIDGNGEQPVLIQMNEPLREGGLVLFQSSWGPQGARPGSPLFSVFSVVRNPSDKWPEYAMWVIFLGLLITFIRRLIGFAGKQAAERNAQAGKTS